MPKHEPETKSDLVAARSPGAWSLVNLHSEVDRLFDEFARGFPWPRMGRGPFPSDLAAGMMPTRVNVAETDSAYEIEAELPGLDEKDVEVSLADNVLTIAGEKQEEKEEKK
jgi:HSP20 family protein